MESKIKVLDDAVINKIAAGEVIENSASVVKELVENALDAGATSITIETKGGGRQLIRITDNGSGMSFDDALLSIERHATSKLRTIDDFDSLLTMGFRGEALASIASISKFTLMTAREGEKGALLKVEGGKIIFSGSVARDRGTTLEIEDLFYNVPVRKKFLKAPSHDNVELLRIITLFALARPDVSFHLVRDGVSFLQSPTTLQERIRCCLGDDFLQQMFPVQFEKGKIKLTGYVGGSRPNRREQYLFINKRAVVSPQIAKTVKEAFGTTLGADRFPCFVLHLEIPSDLVDVNVHPQKREVRLSREEDLIQAILQAITESLQPKSQVACFEFRVQPAHFAVPPPPVLEERVQTYPAPQFQVDVQGAGYQEHLQFQETFIPLPEKERKVVPILLATLPGTLFAEEEGRLFLYHQRRVHHRILFEAMQEGGGELQLLLIPYTFSVTPVDMELLSLHLDFLQAHGLHLRLLTKNSFAVDALPPLFATDSLSLVIQSLLEDIRAGHFKKESEEERVRLSSYGALSMKTRLGHSEGEELLRRLANCKNPTLSPKGEPLRKEITEEIWTTKND